MAAMVPFVTPEATHSIPPNRLPQHGEICYNAATEGDEPSVK